MSSKWKKYLATKAKIEAGKQYSIVDAVSLAKEVSYSSFVWSLEIHIKTYANPKYNDQNIRSTLVLPHGTGKSVKVAAFVSDDKVDEAKTAGADVVGNQDLISEIEKWNIDFDVLVTTWDMMRDLAKVAKVLWPKWLMPSPKAGTVSTNIAKSVDELKKGRIEFKLDKTWNIHVAVWKLNFTDSQLIENIESLLKALQDNKPTWVKWPLIKKAVIAPTMGPGIQIEA